MSRQTVFADLIKNPNYPVLIVGGGINGVGLFRELSLQGIDVLLVERGDFCSGASAAPSRMIHGGLRYLENREIRLVKESLKERDLLLQNAPHYVRPLPTTIPIFSWFAGIIPALQKFIFKSDTSGIRGALVIKLGLMLYDRFMQGRRIVPTHHFSSKSSSLAHHPMLSDDIVCTATYYDASISYPERLCVELILDTEKLHSASHALNYTSLVSAEQNQVTICDELTGDRYIITPRIVVNAGGAWIDTINQNLNQSTHFIGGTKGSHLIIDHDQLYQSVGDEMIFFENAENRICIMFRLHGKVLLGSTDIRITSPDDATTTTHDIDYMLESLKQIFPQIHINYTDIVFHFCGVRPLPYSSPSKKTAVISRDHSCEVLEPDDQIHFPIYSLIGGKWTTFRAFAEQVGDKIMNRLDVTRQKSSEEVVIGGGADYPSDAQKWIADLAIKTTISTERLTELFQRYGTRVREVAGYIADGNDQPLTHHTGYSQREIEFIVHNEKVMHLSDLVLRRTIIALQGDLTYPLLMELAQIIAPICHWSEKEVSTQIQQTQQILQNKHGVILNQPEIVEDIV